MRTRKAYVRQGVTLADATPLVVDLGLTAPVTALILNIEATNGATSNQGIYLPTDIDTIEVVDGSFTLFRMSGVEAHALAYHLGLGLPFSDKTEAAAGVQVFQVVIPFGRWVGDQEYYLEPGKYNNLQVRITPSLTISATAGFATGTGSVDIIAVVFEDSPGPAKGFMMSKNVYSWTTAASGITRFDLPRDWPYRCLMVKAYEDGTAIGTDISNLEMSCDNGGFVPFNMEVAHMARENIDRFGWVRDSFIAFRTDADAVSPPFGLVRAPSVAGTTDLDVVGTDAITGNSVTLQVLSVTVVPAIAKSATDHNLLFGIDGAAPWFTVSQGFGDLAGVEGYFDPVRYKSVELLATEGGAGGAASAVVQQVAR